MINIVNIINNSNWTDWLSEGADLIGPIAKPVTYAYRYRHFIQRQWIKALIAINQGKPGVIVTGTGGAGKSVLMSHYHGEANELDWQEPGTSTGVEIKPVTIGEWSQVVHVVPGQATRERSLALDAAFNQNTFEGVIHVVDYGYTSYRDPTIRSAMVKSGIASIDDLRSYSLQKELEEFEKVCDLIKNSVVAKRGPRWLVIAVNKVDLYLDRMEEASCYYRTDSDSKFVEALERLIRFVGEINLNFAVLPVCSTTGNFEWNSLEHRPQTDSVQHQRAFMRKFIDEVANLANKK